MSARRRALLPVLGAAILLAACAGFDPRPLAEWPDPARVQSLERDGVRVSAGILGDDEASRLYGVDLADAGLQAVWLSVDNRTDRGLWLLVSALDPNYYPPAEAAALFGLGRGAAADQRLLAHFRDLAIPMHVNASGRTEGFVLAPRHEGGRYLNVSLRGAEGVREFGFAVPLANGEFDFERLDAARIYADTALPSLDLAALREKLRELPCCTSDVAGQRAGDPLNLVLAGEATEVLASLARAGWSFTHRLEPRSVRRLIGAALSGNPYPVAPVSPLYLFGRAQDLALQRARGTILQRNHLRLWLAPFRLGERPVWIGQVSRDVSVKATFASTGFVTHVIDPNVDESREALLQSLLVAGVLQRFGFVRGVGAAPRTAMRSNLAGDPYFTDGLRVFAEVSGAVTTLPDRVVFIDWQESADPLLQRPAPSEGPALPGENH